MSEIKEVELPKTMLILKSHVTALGTVETFLRNRGWKIFSTPNLKEALVQIVKNKPSYVLISVDHPNKKVRALPKLLGQAFPVATIVFAENQSSASYKVLNESATEYRVYPPVTGPAIERCVNKYLKDQQTKMTVENANDTFKGDGTNSGNDTIAIKGGGNGNISIKAESGSLGSDQASRLFSQFLGEEGAAGQTGTGKSDEGFGSIVPAGGANAKGDDGFGMPIGSGKNELDGNGQTNSSKQDNNLVFAQPLDEDEQPSAQGYVPGGTPFSNGSQDDIGSGSYAKGENGQQQNGGNGFGKTYVQKGSAGEANGYIPPSDDLGGWGSGKENGPNGQANSAQQDGPGAENGWGSDGKPDGNNSSAEQVGRSGTAHDGMGSREYRRRQAAASAWAPATDNEDYLRRREERRARSDANETLIAIGTQKSLEESVECGDGTITQKLEDTTSATCIMVESERFSGYLVAVMGKNKKIDTLFIETVKQRLFKFLKENGEDVAENQSMDIKMRQVDFEPWALEYADFLRKSAHQGSEVVMAFFPRRPIKAILEESHHQDMAKINLEELQGDRQVEFDLYVYLPTNNKYVLYTPKGGVFYNKQMDRLKKQGVTHMHIQKDAVQAVSKYQAQNYLNDMVEDYEQKQELAAKIKAA